MTDGEFRNALWAWWRQKGLDSLGYRFTAQLRDGPERFVDFNIWHPRTKRAAFRGTPMLGDFVTDDDVCDYAEESFERAINPEGER